MQYQGKQTQVVNMNKKVQREIHTSLSVHILLLFLPSSKELRTVYIVFSSLVSTVSLFILATVVGGKLG